MKIDKIINRITPQTITEIPLMLCGVSCGFPSPADPYVESTLDLNDLLIINPSTTFLIKAVGDSMKDIGILCGDLLIVDKSLSPKHKDVVIAVVYGEFLVKRLYFKNDDVWLCSENRNYKPIRITDASEFHLWGVVTNAIHSLR